MNQNHTYGVYNNNVLNARGFPSFSILSKSRDGKYIKILCYGGDMSAITNLNINP